MVGCSISITRKEVKVSEVRKVMLVLVALSVAGMSLAAVGEDDAKKSDRKGHKGHNRKEMFSKLDTDGSETISLAEFKVGHAKRIAMHKERMGDKWDESRAAKMPSAEDIFNKIDADNTGEITKDEMKSAHKKRAKGHGRKRGEKREDCPNKKADADTEDGV
jgi:hypothetical protein